MKDIELLSRRLSREKLARKQAETILEQKSLELYQANQELRALANTLIDKERRTSALLEATADGFIVLDSQNEIKICNKAACEIFGYERESLIGTNIEKLIPPQSFANESETLNKIISQATTDHLYELTILTNKRFAVPVELRISKIQLTHEFLVICVLRNIYERKQEEHRIATRHEITRILSESASLETAGPRILHIMCKTMHLSVGQMWEVDHASEILRCITSWSEDEKYIELLQASKMMTFKKGQGLPGGAWETGEIFWIEDVNTDKRFLRSAWTLKAGLQSAFALPLKSGNDVIGILEFYMPSLHQLDEKLLKMLSDISNQLAIFIEREHAQKRSLLARRAGMADVATAILHNVGNILNSVNVSVGMMYERMNDPFFDKFYSIIKLIDTNKHNLNHYLVKDPIGKVIPQYLNVFASSLEAARKKVLDEIANLGDHVHHIREITDLQKSISGVSMLEEKVYLAEVIDSAIKMCSHTMNTKHINIITQFQPRLFIKTDKAKLLQVLVNLIQNAKDALSSNADKEKNIIIRTKKTELNSIIIIVEDNGIGILAENVINIFSFGFTTKVEGHGFGLHSSALAAKELGGRLEAHSSGLNQGATFTLTLPLNTSSEVKA